MASTIPLLDLARWFDGTLTDRAALAREVDEHLGRLGFLVVVNHGVPSSVIDECRRAALEFFHGPAEVKAAVAVPPDIYRGWVGPGLESNAASYGVDTPPDLKESFTFGPVDLPDESIRTTNPAWYSPNRWPAEPLRFQAACEAWWRAARQLHDELLDLLSLALGLPETHLRDLSTAGTSQSTINWYGPREGEPLPGQFRVGPHTDFGMLTVLDREPGLGGLQVQDETGEWVDAPDVPGALIINTGDLFRRWTNDRWMSNVHRVLPPPDADPDEELVSLVFFGEPDFDVPVEAFASCVTDAEPRRYPAVRSHDYLLAKIQALAV